MTVVMTPDDWEIAKAIAQNIRATGTDANELKKAVTYLGWLRNRHQQISNDHLFTYLSTLIEHGEIRSKKTVQHYQTIEQTSRTHLDSKQIEGDTLIHILAWASKLA